MRKEKGGNKMLSTLYFKKDSMIQVIGFLNIHLLFSFSLSLPSLLFTPKRNVIGGACIY